MNDREISKNMSRSPSLIIQQYDLFQNGYKQPDYDRRISAIKIDEDYKKYRQTKETGLCKYAASASKTNCQKC